MYDHLLIELKGSTICASIIVERFNNNLLKYNRATTIRSYLELKDSIALMCPSIMALQSYV